jgi:acyl-CoA hydrolase
LWRLLPLQRRVISFQVRPVVVFPLSVFPGANSFLIGASVGATPELIQSAEKIIVEVNTRIPNLEGLHDINYSFVPPNRLPYVRSSALW